MPGINLLCRSAGSAEVKQGLTVDRFEFTKELGRPVQSAPGSNLKMIEVLYNCKTAVSSSRVDRTDTGGVYRDQQVSWERVQALPTTKPEQRQHGAGSTQNPFDASVHIVQESNGETSSDERNDK